MSGYVDLNYINKIQPRLQQFKKKRDYLFNFRCPICGDSKKSKTKARAYLYRVKVDMFFKCHNCGSSHNLANFIKSIDRQLYDQYILEKYKGNKTSIKPDLFKQFKNTTKEKLKSTPLQGLKSFNSLDDKHPAKKYLVKRKIPEEFFGKLFYTDRFQAYVNTIRPGTFNELNKQYEHPRLVIPFYDVDDEVFAIQGRAFGKEQPKYITIKLQENKQKIYGLNTINLHKRLYIVEGPLDSLFLDNCIAAAGADLVLPVETKDVVFVFDNEPRNKHIIDRMYKVIDKDYSLIIWPDNIREKDINEMIIKGKTKSQVQQIISDNTYSGLSALTKINSYKRC
jgi:transcription elongation factor Elf1